MQSYKELTSIDINLLKYLACHQNRDVTVDEVLQEFKAFDYAERRKLRIEDRFFRTVPIIISLIALSFSAYALFR